MAVKILEENDYIKEYVDNSKYENVIKIAIRNHNKLNIENNLSEYEKKFCKIIRDADKIDILWQSVELFWKYDNAQEEMENSTISEDIQKQFNSMHIIDKKTVKESNPIDNIIIRVAFIYDINYKTSFKIIDKEKYFDKIISRFNFKNQSTNNAIQEIRKKANQYVIEKIYKG